MIQLILNPLKKLNKVQIGDMIADKVGFKDAKSH